MSRRRTETRVKIARQRRRTKGLTGALITSMPSKGGDRCEELGKRWNVGHVTIWVKSVQKDKV